jgi:asparagine synthase (glutamine-hydrolysing)
LAPAPEWHHRADRLLVHRGPDAAGHYADDWCELVHRRLALIDLSASGHQPLCNETGDVQVIYNGEIYNHRDLRSRLEQRGHVFRSTSDTEVLVHLYEERGDQLVEDLRGIFAFAIYDRPRRRLLLARDRYGVKPLFYARHGGQLVFASEIKAITALPGFEPRLDRQACWDYLGLSYVPEPATGFANVHALPRASTLAVSNTGWHVESYYRPLALAESGRRLPETTSELADVLLRAVKSQAVADVPVAALLSGGIDSSLVVAAHRRATGERTTTFNVRFPDPRHDETPRAVAVADHCGTRHHVIELGDYQLSADALLGLMRHFDQPFADTSFIPMYWVSRAIRDRGIICALSGDGGDEVFGGYGRFWRANRLARLMAAPSWVRTALVGTGRALAGVTRDWGRQVAKAAALASAGRHDSAVLLSGMSNYLSEEQKIELLVPDARERLLPVHRHYDGYRPTGTEDLEELSRRMTETLFAVSLPSDMLRKVDMMSMRASIEVRVPLLDEDVVGLGLMLPHRLKTDGREGKLVLRALAERWLPPRVAHLPKHGFSIPLDVMVPSGVHEVLDDLLLGTDARTTSLLNRDLVREWLGKFRRADNAARRGGTISRAGLYQRVFMLLSLELWMRDHRLTW